ncbi:hypothetical protein [Nonomuraea sp. NPDC003201]
MKGSDAARAARLRAAAERADCEITLALAEIQETWDAYDPDEDEDAWEGDYEDVLQDLIETHTTLAHWIGPEQDGSRTSRWTSAMPRWSRRPI